MNATTCPDCGTTSDGRFCPSCGQRVDVDPRELRHWVRSFFDETLSLDGRLPRTLGALLTRPGVLTEEWRGGRRTRWTAPFRVFLLCSVTLFAANLVAPDGVIEFSVQTGTGQTAAELATARQSAADAARDYGPQVLFLLAPVLAGLLHGLFWRAKQLYVEHLVHSFHLHAAGFLALSAFFLLEFIPSPFRMWGQIAVLLGLVAYLPTSARRVYGLPWFGTVLRSCAVFFVHLILALIAFGGAATLAGSPLVESVEDATADYDRMRTALESGDSARARALSDDVAVGFQRLEAHLHTPLIKARLAQALLLDDRPEEARVVALEALAREPDHPLALGYAALATVRTEGPGAAEAHRARFLRALAEPDAAPELAEERSEVERLRARLVLDSTGAGSGL